MSYFDPLNLRPRDRVTVAGDVHVLIRRESTSTWLAKDSTGRVVRCPIGRLGPPPVNLGGAIMRTV